MPLNVFYVEVDQKQYTFYVLSEIVTDRNGMR